MKLQIIKENDLILLKNNLSSYAKYFTDNDNSWITREIDHNIFTDTNLILPDCDLDTSKETPFETDYHNSQKFYNKFKFLTDVQASDERIWAALCLGRYWNYVLYRWNLKNTDSLLKNIKQHFFFSYSTRRSLTRNALSRLWWISRLTYDKNSQDPYELTKFVCSNQRYIVDILERNTSNNISILRPSIRAVLDASREGIVINTEQMRNIEIYLDELGSTYVIDCIPEQKIHDKIFNKILQISKTHL